MKNKNLNLILIVICIVTLSFFLIVGIPLIINKVYLRNAGYVTVWGAKEVLAYYGAVLSFIGTVVLGYFSVLVAKQAKDISNKLMNKEMAESSPFANMKTEILVNTKTLEKCSVRFENLHSIYSTNVIFIESVSLSEKEISKRHFIEYLFKFSFENTSKNKIKEAYILSDSLTIFKSNPYAISKFTYRNTCDKSKLFINYESDHDFSFCIKLYAFSDSIANYILNNDDEISLAFKVEYVSITNIKNVIFHQMWLKRANDNYAVLGTRNTELEEEK